MISVYPQDSTSYFPFDSTANASLVECFPNSSAALKFGDEPPPLPEPPPPRDNGGLCHLDTEEWRMQFCGTGIENPFPRPSPNPPPQNCPGLICIDVQAAWLVAVVPVDHCLRCTLAAFRPFHRTGVAPEMKVEEGHVFDFNLAFQYVRNFDPKNMQIVGPDFLKLENGFLKGQAPTTGRPTIYEFSVTAWNKAGESDPLVLTISVAPRARQLK